MNKETKEEYLEILFKLAKGKEDDRIKTGQIAKELGLKPPTVTEVLPKLEEEGLLEYIPYHGVRLKDKGKEMGKNIVRTHRVLEVFLKRYFDLEDDILHEKACQMEHIFDEKMINEMCRRLGVPEECPHGNDIPPCKEVECPVEGDED